MPFNEKKASRAFRFFTQCLRRPDGDGGPYRPTVWQYECIRDVYGTVGHDGLRQYKLALILIGKKNGKSDFAAANSLYMLAGDGNPDAQIYLTASSSKQTGNVYKPAAQMVECSPLLANEYRTLKSTHVIQSRANPLFNRLEVISADGDKNDGFKTHGAVADELHRWRERKALELWGALLGGRISAKEPLVWIITTAGEMDESPLLWQYYEYAKGIQAGTIPKDPSFYFRIFEPDPNDDDDDPATWRKANPSLEIEDPETRRKVVAAGLHPGFLKLSELEELHRAGKYMPKARQDFRRLHLNRWGARAQEESPFSMPAWLAQVEEQEPLLDRVCYGGLDLSTSTDLSSLTLHFPDDDEEMHDVLSFSWLPAERLKQLELRSKVPFLKWTDTALLPPMVGKQRGDAEKTWRVLFATEGNAVDYTKIREFILSLSKLFVIEKIGYDPKLANESAQWLLEHGIDAVPVAQHAGQISEPFNKAIALVADGKVRHGNNPLFNWALGCTRLKQTDDNLIRLKKPERDKDSKRIDPIAAWVNALWCMLRYHQGESVYERRGVSFIR